VLGDYGADVIKVEPFGGDGYRKLSRPWRTDYNWQLTSRNKRSIALDLNKAEAQAVLRRLVDRADVLVLNFFDDQLQRFGLTYDALRASNPRLVYARMSGFGTRGPEARKRGFDSTAWWARTGLMDLVRDKGQAPVMGSPGFGDHSSAMSLFGAIMLGLYRREQTGEGCSVGSSLLANGIWANGMQVQGAIAGFDFGALRQEKGLRSPLTSVYETADGRHLLFTILNTNREWPDLCEVLGRSEWQQRYPNIKAIMKARDVLKAGVAEVIGSWTLNEARQRLDAADITYSVVQNLEEVIADEQAHAAGVLIETGSEDPDYRLTVASPIEVAEEDKRAPGKAPEIGEHSREILAEAGFEAGEIDQLLAGEFVAEPARESRTVG
jgi:formyl-CoA transferase